MTERIFNFSAGPAVLPVPVLEEAQRDLLSLPGVGMSVMEISHRSKTFDEIIAGAESELRELNIALQRTRARVVVVDTQREFESSAETRRLAEILHAHFIKLT